MIFKLNISTAISSIITPSSLRLLLFFLFFVLQSSAQSVDGVGSSKEKTIVISFRRDKDNIDWNYIDNKTAKLELERLFTNPVVLKGIDSLLIIGSASPEGNYFYNQNLSERRLNSTKRYMLSSYPDISSIITRYSSIGADWDGLLKLVEQDINVPFREEILNLIKSKVPIQDKELMLRRIGDGEAYRYMLQNIFHSLRTGIALVGYYPIELESVMNPIGLESIDSIPKLKLANVADKFTIMPGMQRETREFRYVRPFAIKTNLLFDVASLLNIEIEVPISKRFSVMAEYTFPWWGGLGNRGGVAPLPAYSDKYTMQMLYGGLEGRYWFPRGKKLNDKSTRWNDYNALSGWFVGIYGGVGLYDFQFGKNKKGIQGELYIAGGLSGGYAHPIGKHFHMEYSLGLGYLATEYYRYAGMNGEKVVDVLPDGSYDYRKQTWIGPTKLKISLVWFPRFKVRNRK